MAFLKQREQFIKSMQADYGKDMRSDRPTTILSLSPRSSRLVEANERRSIYSSFGQFLRLASRDQENNSSLVLTNQLDLSKRCSRKEVSSSRFSFRGDRLESCAMYDE